MRFFEKKRAKNFCELRALERVGAVGEGEPGGGKKVVDAGLRRHDGIRAGFGKIPCPQAKSFCALFSKSAAFFLKRT